VVKHVDDGSTAQYQQIESGVHLHYKFTGFDMDKQNEKTSNTVNLTTAIQEQQNLNLSNPSLEPDGNTYCTTLPKMFW
jgi:hypothetical protein